MKTKTFLNQLQQQDIIQAIVEAEKKTSGEIRVMISPKSIPSIVSFAERQFVKSKMDRTKERNAVLIVIAPRSQNFAVVGDQGIHDKIGNSCWEKITDLLSHYFKDEAFHQGLLAAINKVGEQLAQHFPRKPSDQNELSDRPI